MNRTQMAMFKLIMHALFVLLENSCFSLTAYHEIEKDYRDFLTIHDSYGD